MKHILALTAIVFLVVTACGGEDTADRAQVEPDGGNGDSAISPNAQGPFPIAGLTVTIEHPDVANIEYGITCLGDTATVTGHDELSAEAACTRLALPEVQQRLVSPPLRGDRVCTEIYGGPDTARFEGTLDEQPVNTTIDRTNGCGISDWDDVLSGVLPPAIGVTE